MKVSGLFEAFKFHDYGLRGLNIRDEALKFQQLVIENPYIEVDAQLDVIGDKLFVHVSHPEFIDLSFNVADDFSVDFNGYHELCGSRAEHAYEHAFPAYISWKPSIDIGKMSGIDACHSEVESDSDSPNGTTASLKVEYNTENENDGIAFKWVVSKQCWMIIPDEHNSGPCEKLEFKTMKAIESYIEAMVDSLER